MIDNYSALMGLAAYRWLAGELGDTAEYNWATDEYSSLLDAVNQTLATRSPRTALNYLPCSMVEPNDSQPLLEPEGRQLGGAVPVRPLGLGRLPV